MPYINIHKVKESRLYVCTHDCYIYNGDSVVLRYVCNTQVMFTYATTDFVTYTLLTLCFQLSLCCYICNKRHPGLTVGINCATKPLSYVCKMQVLLHM